VPPCTPLPDLGPLDRYSGTNLTHLDLTSDAVNFKVAVEGAGGVQARFDFRGAKNTTAGRTGRWPGGARPSRWRRRAASRPLATHRAHSGEKFASTTLAS
jgi:hypothetical protein